MKQSGFTLIELLVSLAIASILGMALFSSFDLLNRTVQLIDNLVDMSMRASIVMQRMEKDISGAFIPVQARKKKEAAQPTNNVQDQKPPAAAEQPQKKPLTHVFYGTQKDGMFHLLTFITNNPAQAYWAGSTGIAKPNIVRIVYRLEQEQQKRGAPPSYALMRQESTELNYDAYAPDKQEPIRSYELIGGIKKMTVKYTAQTVKEKKEVKDDKEIITTETDYKVVDEWLQEEAQSQTGTQKRSMMPFAVDVELLLWDLKKQKDKKYVFKTLLIPKFVELQEETVPQPLRTTQPKPETEQVDLLMITDQLAQPPKLTGPKAAGKPSAIAQTRSIVGNLFNMPPTQVAQGAKK